MFVEPFFVFLNTCDINFREGRWQKEMWSGAWRFGL